MIFRLAYKNLVGAGLRTWLNVFVLSFTFVMIVGLQGMYDGMNRFAYRAMVDTEIGGGQVWHPDYDPYDPLSLETAHGLPPAPVQQAIRSGDAVPELIVQATVYPEGRMQAVLLKGVAPDQDILTLPTNTLSGSHSIPALIGTRMAASLHVGLGDEMVARLRDADGTFDAVELDIVHIMRTSVPTVDLGQIWVPLSSLQQLTGMEGEITLATFRPGQALPPDPGGWITRDVDYLMRDFTEMLAIKQKSSGIMYLFLLFISLLAVFDTQVLAVFRRQKEMGTLISLGMTRKTLIQLFTLEGAFHGVLALGLAVLYGGPLLWLMQTKGFAIPDYAGQFGFALSDRLFPYYGPGLILGTSLLALISVTLVSYWPTRKIARLNPTEALRGKRQ